MCIHDTLILLVDNDEQFLSHVVQLLKENNFKNVMVASTCDEAKKICETQYKPYLIIMEFNFESQTADDFIKTLKSKCDRLKFIVVSGSDKLADSLKSIHSGASSFIHKSSPVRDDLILSSVDTWLTHFDKKYYNTVRSTLNQINVA